MFNVRRFFAGVRDGFIEAREESRREFAVSPGRVILSRVLIAGATIVVAYGLWAH